MPPSHWQYNMLPKDYYKILDVKPDATPGDIKKNYRRLAMKYHPDRNQGDTLTEAVFSDIAEAYDTLSDPAKRREYHQKKYNTYAGDDFITPEVTRESILNSVTKLEKTVAILDPFRLNRDALYFNILQILHEDTLTFLHKQNDRAFNRTIVNKLLQCSKLLSFIYIKKVSGLLLNIAGNDEDARNAVNTFVEKAGKGDLWNRYKVLGAILIAAILCLLIFLLGGR